MLKNDYKIFFSGKKFLIPLQWRFSIPKILAEFLVIHQIITDMPPEMTIMQVGAELTRRLDETLAIYGQNPDHLNDRISEDNSIIIYVTPYDHMTMPFMNDWNNLLIDAIQVPSVIGEKFYNAEIRIPTSNNITKTEW